jgi:hypothetical protein
MEEINMAEFRIRATDVSNEVKNGDKVCPDHR